MAGYAEGMGRAAEAPCGRVVLVHFVRERKDRMRVDGSPMETYTLEDKHVPRTEDFSDVESPVTPGRCGFKHKLDLD